MLGLGKSLWIAVIRGSSRYAVEDGGDLRAVLANAGMRCCVVVDLCRSPPGRVRSW